MKEESDTSNDVLERLATCHLRISPHNHLLSMKQESPPHASSSPSPTSMSSITSISKVTSSTNGNGTSLSNVAALAPGLDFLRQHMQAYGNMNMSAIAAAVAAFHPMNPDAQSQFLLMQELANQNALSSTNSTRSKSSSSDVSNGGSPLSTLSLSVKPKSKPGTKARSPSTGSVASSTGNREKVFVCQICNRSFGYKHVLQNHERTHTGEKPFECRECHKRFTRDHHLKTHMRLHTGEKPYHCNHCDRQFVQVANLRRHLRVHTGEKPYACELCSSRFSDSNQLKAHMLIHKGEKPFQCKKCEGRFRRRHHLNHHKCPKDEANLGKPRRGRRPKAYDQLQSASPNSLSSSRPGSADELLAHLPLLTSAAVSSTTSNASSNSFYHGPKPHHLPPYHHRSPTISPHHLLSSPASMPPNAHFVDMNSVPKSRRKPRHTNRILPQLQHSGIFNDIDDRDEEDGMQTQPLNLSISPALTVSKQLSAQLNARRAFSSSPANTDDDVLDLSRSRSDESEPEPIEEDEDDEDEGAKDDEDIDEVVMMHQKSFLENGQDSSFRRHQLGFDKHYSSNHINNNHCSKNAIFSQKLPGLDEKTATLLEKGNGISALDLAAFNLASLKMKTPNSNGVPVPLIKPSNESKSAAESMANE